MLSADIHLLFKSYLDSLEDGPYEEDYLKLTYWMFRANQEQGDRTDVPYLFPKSLWDKDYVGQKSLFHRIFNAGRVVGNYAIMRDLYSGKVEEGLSYHDTQWDTYIQSQISSLAVRQRKEELYNTLLQTNAESFLDIACGSGIGAEVMQKYHRRIIRYVGVDADQEAVDYCKKTHSGPSNQFLKQDIRKLSPKHHGTFDVVWCSGLFDYFSSDLVFMKAAKTLLDMSKGVVVIGNMGPANMTIPMMSLLGWNLRYRSKHNLAQLAMVVRSKYKNFLDYRITSDPTGIQHYLYLYK